MFKSKILGPDGKPASYMRFYRFLKAADQVSRHPLIITLVSLFLGSVLLKSVEDAKAQRQLKTQLAVKFLEDTAEALNDTFSRCFTQIRSPSEETSIYNKEYIKSREALFTSRLTVTMKSRTLLNRPNFAKDYDEITWTLNDIGGELAAIRKGKDPNVSVREMMAKEASCEKRWGVKPKAEDLPAPYDACFLWAECAWIHCQNTLTAELQLVTKDD